MEMDEEALERRVRSRMVFEKAKADFVTADTAAVNLVKRLNRAVTAMTASSGDYHDRLNPKRISFGRNSPTDALDDVPTAEEIRRKLNEFVERSAAMREAHGLLDPIDKAEVKLAQGAVISNA